MIRVRNMTSPRSGNDVANQYIIQAKGYNIFQSYSSTIAIECVKSGTTYLDENKWDYSKTTMKYLNMFLGTSNKADITLGIENGRYALKELNDEVYPIR